MEPAVALAAAQVSTGAGEELSREGKGVTTRGDGSPRPGLAAEDLEGLRVGGSSWLYDLGQVSLALCFEDYMS